MIWVVRVTAISDLHGYLPANLPGGDLLILAGDYVNGSPHADQAALAKQRAWLKEPLFEWLIAQPYQRVLAIAGNHDFALEDEAFARSLPWTYLLDETVVIGGVIFSGTPWVPGLPAWAFHGTEEQLRARADAIPHGVDVLVSHGPPAGMLDHGFGDATLNDAIARVVPSYVICGHVHEGRGRMSSGHTVVANVSVVDALYEPYPLPPVTFEIPAHC